MTHDQTMVSQPGRHCAAPPVEVLVGSDKKSYYIHRGVLAAEEGSAIYRRLNGACSEKWTAALDWSEFDQGTIERVIDYLYTGEYYVFGSEDEEPMKEIARDVIEEPPPADEEPVAEERTVEAVPQEPEVPPSPSPPPDAPEEVSFEISKFDRPLTPISTCLEAGLPLLEKDTAAGTLAYRTKEYTGSSFGAAVFAHVKVYIFAHQFFVSGLQTYALQNLAHLLTFANGSKSDMFPGIADAIRYLYEKTPGEGSQPDPARKILSQHAAINFVAFAKEGLGTLMAEGGDFASDLCDKLARRVTTDLNHIKSLETANRILTRDPAKTKKKKNKDSIIPLGMASFNQ